MLYYFVLFLALSCQREPTDDQGGGPVFETTPKKSTVDATKVKEASGIADSKANAGHIWVQQDSGNPPDIFLLKHDGSLVKSIHLANATNRDWEDMYLSAGPQAGKNYLYIGETGDNNLIHNEYIIYRFEEPVASVDTVKQVDKISFQYADGKHDCEAFVVDPTTKDIYLITKNDNPSKIFKLTYPYSTSSSNTATQVGTLTYNFVVSAAVSPDKKGIAVKTYGGINYYAIKSGETIPQALAKTPVALPYAGEPQGEAITFATDNSGYFTLSEKSLLSSVSLYFYKKK